MPLPVFDPRKRPVFVVGNEAADADSLVSAYAAAVLLEDDEVQAVALAQIPREEFRLRRDAVMLLAEAGVEVAADGSPAHMCFWDEVDWGQVDRLERRALVLTDHNVMSPQVAEHFEGRVEQVLDHHASSGMYPGAQVDIDEALGSACTLVAERFQARSPEVPREIGVLLAGVIILDCRNFDPKDGRGTARDRAALKQLEPFIPAAGAASWFKALMKARKDVSHFSLRELFVLDVKVATASDGSTAAFCAIFVPLEDMCKRVGGPAALLSEVGSFAQAKGYTVVVGMFAKDENKRKGLTLTPNPGSGELGVALCGRIGQNLVDAPENLVPELRENELFSDQNILKKGFGLVPQDQLRPLRAFTFRGACTRKTMLPCAMMPGPDPGDGGAASHAEAKRQSLASSCRLT